MGSVGTSSRGKVIRSIHVFSKQDPSSTLVLFASLAVLGLAGCGNGEPPASQTASVPAIDSGDPARAEADRAAELAAREAELVQREAELALQEREQALARREAELASRESTPTKPAVRPAAPTPARSSTAASASAPAPVAVPPKAPEPVVLVVPAGTQLSIALASALSTKTAVVGQTFDARLASDVMVDGRRALDAGSIVAGTVTEVVSGSRKIGGVPTLGLRFDSVALEDGRKLAINGRLVQQAKSDTAQDTAKIVGGTAVGAVIGHQINDGSGKILGGVLGGAAGALIAQKTGSEVELPADALLTIALDTPLEVR
jgi:Glycine zipper 2TM domain